MHYLPESSLHYTHDIALNLWLAKMLSYVLLILSLQIWSQYVIKVLEGDKLWLWKFCTKNYNVMDCLHNIKMVIRIFYITHKIVVFLTPKLKCSNKLCIQVWIWKLGEWFAVRQTFDLILLWCRLCIGDVHIIHQCFAFKLFSTSHSLSFSLSNLCALIMWTILLKWWLLSNSWRWSCFNKYFDDIKSSSQHYDLIINKKFW